MICGAVAVAALQRADAEPRLGALVRVGAVQVVESAAGVRLEIEKALVLALQRGDQRQQRDVLVHVGEIAGMKTVAVFHARGRECALA